jgi:PKD repeat protein
MNLYLIEPYNAYAPKGRKKHPMEIAEEEFIYYKMVENEKLKLQEAQLAAQQIQNQSIAAAGAGGSPPRSYFHPEEDTIDFSGNITTAAGPLTVIFSNLSTNPQYYTFSWNFGDGTTDTNPTPPAHLYNSGSVATCSLTATHIDGHTVTTTTKNSYISASIPVVTAAFTFTTSSTIAPFTAAFTNTSTNTSQTTTNTYLWTFSDTGSTLSSKDASHICQSGSFTASLQATGSYNLSSKYTQSFFATAPTLTSIFTFTTSSVSAPSTASFTNSSTYNGHGSLTYLWTYGSGSLSSTDASPLTIIYKNAGGYTASLQITESSYNIKSIMARSWSLA